jgi:hypothetical protein
MKSRIKQIKHEAKNADKPLLHSDEYVAFEHALKKVLTVSHSELGKRIADARKIKREAFSHASNGKD